jgi:pimeloyl-ACP methyl ester carboxylesterase
MEHILLLHGAIGSSRQMKPLADAISESFKVHTLDFSGHGGRDTEVDFSIEQFSKDLEDYIINHDLAPAKIVGYSMGGYVALYLSARKPELIERVVTHGTKFKWTPEIALKESAMLNPDKIAEKIPAFAKALEERHHPADWRTVIRKTADMMVQMGSHPPLIDELLSNISIPVRISLGDRDEMVSIEETLHVYKTLPHASMQMLPDTRHPVEKINYSEFYRSVLSFLNGKSGSAKIDKRRDAE